MNACVLTDGLAWGMIVLGLATFVFLSTGFCAPYGRYANGSNLHTADQSTKIC